MPVDGLGAAGKGREMRDGAGSHPVAPSKHISTYSGTQATQPSRNVGCRAVGVPSPLPTRNPPVLPSGHGRSAPNADLLLRAPVPPGNAPRCRKTTRANPKEPNLAQERGKRRKPVPMKEKSPPETPLARPCPPEVGQKSGKKGRLSPSRQAARMAQGHQAKPSRCPVRDAPGKNSLEGGSLERRNVTAPKRVISQRK